MLALLPLLVSAPLAIALIARERPWLGYLLGGSLLLLSRALAGAGASPLFWIAQATFFVSAVLTGIPSFRTHLFAGPLARRLGPRLRAVATLRRAEHGAERAQVLQPGPDQLLLDGPRGWERFLQLQAPPLSHAEQNFLDGPIERLTTGLTNGSITAAEGREHLLAERIAGLQLSQRDGGRGFSDAAWSRCVQRIALAHPVLGAWVATASCGAAAHLLRDLGSPRQRQALLPELARARACFALVAGAPSGAASGGGVIERGAATGAPQLRIDLIAGAVPLAACATHVIAVLQIDDPERLLGEEREFGALAVVLPRDLSGLELPPHSNELDPIRCMGPLRIRACRIGLEHVLGGPESAPRTPLSLAAALTHSRATVLPSLAAGLGQRVLRDARPVQRQRLAALAHLLESGRTIGQAAVSGGARPGPFAVDLRRRTAELWRELALAGNAQRAGDLHGNAHTASPHDLPDALSIDGEPNGPSGEAWSHGGAHLFAEELDSELAALDALDLEAFDRAAAAHLTRLSGRSARTWIDGLRRGHAAKSAVPGIAANLFRRVEHVSRSQALASELIPLGLGSDLPRAAAITDRLSDARGWITLAAASLREFHARSQRELERPTVTAAVDLALGRATRLLDEALDGLPRRRQARALRLLLFPLGRPSPEERAAEPPPQPTPVPPVELRPVASAPASPAEPALPAESAPEAEEPVLSSQS